jgi:hypothetical protein
MRLAYRSRKIQAFSAVEVDNFSARSDTPKLVGSTITGVLLQQDVIGQAAVRHIKAFATTQVNNLSFRVESPDLVRTVLAMKLLHFRVVGGAAPGDVDALAAELIDNVSSFRMNFRVASLPGGGDACAGVTVLFGDREEGAWKILFQFPMTAVATTPSRPMIATMICIETELSRLLSGSAIIHAFTQHGSRVGILRILIPRLIVP